MRKSCWAGFGVVGVLALGCAGAAPAARAPTAPLPLSTLRLYETGVGYFERSGRLGADDTELPVPAAHVDDALMSLVVSGQSGTRLVGVEFESVVSRGLARALSGLPQRDDDPVSWQELVTTLEGVPIELRTGGKLLRGRVLDVFEAAPSVPSPPPKAAAGSESVAAPLAEKVPWIVFVGVEGALRQVELSRVESLRPLDAEVGARLGAAAETLSSRAARARRSLRLLGRSGAPVTLGYVAETPVWRSSYRLVLAPGSSARLQGWALLHNDTDESWRGVRIELLSGRPDSFLFPMAAPRYARRELAKPTEELSTVPQLADRTVDQMWGDHVEGSSSGVATGSGYGYGSGSGRLGGSHSARVPSMRVGGTSGTVASEALTIGSLASVAPAEGSETGALFRYALGDELDLRAHGSALVPFVDAGVDARRMTRFAKPDTPGRAALRFVNRTGQTVPAGPLALYEGGTFAGQSALVRLKPGERQFLEFGTDLDVELELVSATSRDETALVRLEQRTLVVDFRRAHQRKYRLAHRGATPRTVALVLDVVDNARVTGADSLDYDEGASRALALFELGPRARREIPLSLEEGLSVKHSVESLAPERLRELAAAAALTAPVKAALEAAQREAQTLADKRKAINEAESDLGVVTQDLERLREHARDVEKGAATAAPIVQRILADEDRLVALRKRLAALGTERDAALAALERALAPLAKQPEAR